MAVYIETLISWVLLAILPTQSSSMPVPGTLSVSNSIAPVNFTATGLDYGFMEFALSGSKNVTYQ